MRIIHEIHTPMQVSGGPHPYRNTPGVGGYNGVRVEVHMSTSPEANFPKDAKLLFDDKTEVIEIEGSLEVVLDTFRSVVSMLESTKEYLQKELGPKRIMDCPNCEEPTKETHVPNGCHTWECKAKWDATAQEQLDQDATLAEAQRKMVLKAAERVANEHQDCGGAGCAKCKWTGKKAT